MTNKSESTYLINTFKIISPVIFKIMQNNDKIAYKKLYIIYYILYRFLLKMFGNGVMRIQLFSQKDN